METLLAARRHGGFGISLKFRNAYSEARSRPLDTNDSLSTNESDQTLVLKNRLTWKMTYMMPKIESELLVP